MRIIVKPAHQRSRWFRDLTAAMLFAEKARTEQGAKIGCVEVHIYDGRSPHFFATYGRPGGITSSYVWRWSYKKGF